jgi:cytoskeleton protein RodZ
VTVQTDTGRILFQGTLPRGDRRDIPRLGKLQVTSDLPENLRVNIGGTEWPLTDPHGAFLKSAVIMPK